MLDDSDGDNIYETTLNLKLVVLQDINLESTILWDLNGFEPDGALVSGGCSCQRFVAS